GCWPLHPWLPPTHDVETDDDDSSEEHEERIVANVPGLRGAEPAATPACKSRDAIYRVVDDVLLHETVDQPACVLDRPHEGPVVQLVDVILVIQQPVQGRDRGTDALGSRPALVVHLPRDEESGGCHGE